MQPIPQTKAIIELLLAGHSRRAIAEALGASEREVARWLADPDFLREARRELTNRLVALIPKALHRLEELLDSESDTQAMNAIKLIIKQLESAGDYDSEMEKMINRLEPIVDMILAEIKRDRKRVISEEEEQNAEADREITG